MDRNVLDQKLRTALLAGEPAVVSLANQVRRLIEDELDLDVPLFHIVRTTDRAMRTFCGRWTSSRIGAGIWTREEADYIDKVLLVGSYAVDIIPEGTSPYVAN